MVFPIVRLVPATLYLIAMLLLLFSLIPPVHVFHDRSVLLEVHANTTSDAATERRLARRSPVVDRHQPVDLWKRRWVRHVKRDQGGGHLHVARAASSSLNFTSLYVGPLGACAKDTSDETWCTEASFTPVFIEVYQKAGLSESAYSALPDQFPLAPAVLLLSLVFISMSFLAALLSLFGNPDDPKRIKILAQRRALLFKGSLACAFASLALGLASMLSFRIELASHVRDFNDIAGAVAEAKLGTAYGQAWAAFCLTALGTLVAILHRPQ